MQSSPVPLLWPLVFHKIPLAKERCFCSWMAFPRAFITIATKQFTSITRISLTLERGQRCHLPTRGNQQLCKKRDKLLRWCSPRQVPEAQGRPGASPQQHHHTAAKAASRLPPSLLPFALHLPLSSITAIHPLIQPYPNVTTRLGMGS